MSGISKLYGAMERRAAQAAAGIASSVSYGTVTGVDPLVISRDGEATRAPLTAGFLVLSVTCRRKVVSAAHVHTVATAEGTYTTSEWADEVLLWDDLQLGERVILLSFDASQKFFVERVVL